MGKSKEKPYYRQVVLKDLSQFSKIYLVPLSDLHVINSVEDIVQGYVDWIAERDNAFTILNGDLIDGATKTSASELYDNLTTPDKSYEIVRDLLLPIKDKVLMITRGNHCESIYKQVGTDYMARMAYDLGNIPYQPDGGILGMRLSLHDHGVMCWVYAVHGWGGARTIGAKVKKVQDLALVADVDIYCLSHDHTQNVNRGNIMRPPRSKITFDRPNYWSISRKLFVNTGGFIPYTGYVRRKGYTPQDLGTPRIRIEVQYSHQESYHLDLHSSI